MYYDPVEDCIKILLRYALDKEHRSLQRELRNKKRRISERLKSSQNNAHYHQLVNEHFSSAKLANEAFRLLQRSAQELHKIDELIKQAKLERKACRTIRNFSKTDDITQLIAQLAKIYVGLKQERDTFNIRTRELNDNTAELRGAIRTNCGARGQGWYDRLQTRKRLN